MYEYESQRIAIPRLHLTNKTLAQADRQRRRIVNDYAARGWRLVQIIPRFAGICHDYELIFERGCNPA